MLGDRLLASVFTKAMQDHIIITFAAMNKALPLNLVPFAYWAIRKDSPVLEMLADMHVSFYVRKEPQTVDDLADEIEAERLGSSLQFPPQDHAQVSAKEWRGCLSESVRVWVYWTRGYRWQAVS
jgi:hypothetical protein